MRYRGGFPEYVPVSRKREKAAQKLQDLMEGRFPRSLEDLFMAKGSGLFPSPREITFRCSCLETKEKTSPKAPGKGPKKKETASAERKTGTPRRKKNGAKTSAGRLGKRQ